MTDRALIYTSAFLRAFTTGLIGVLLGLYLAELAISSAASGYMVAAGLAGATVAALVVTWYADRLARRGTLIALSLLTMVGAVGITMSSLPLWLGIAAFIGMLNGMGRDRGAQLILEHAILPSLVSNRERTKTFAIYSMNQDIGHALGALAAGLPALVVDSKIWPTLTRVSAYQGAFIACGLFALAGAAIYVRLSSRIEPAERIARHVSPATRRVLWKISSLFFIDSLGGGFLTSALVAYFFFERFQAPEVAIAGLFFFARVANAISHLGAAWLAGRIGLVNTMVFTHLPSSLLLMTVAFAPNFPVAAILFVFRESLVEMDVPTRQSYVMALVRPEERTVASGVTNLVRMAGWAIAPAIAGPLMGTLALGAPLFIGAGLKIAYDVVLYRAFRRIKPPEEVTVT